MTSERWRLLKEYFHSAMDLPPAERSAYLAGIRAEHPSLLGEIESLLAANEQEGEFLQQPAADLAGAVLNTSCDTQDLCAGKSLGRYTILGLLGRGGMGEIYRAKDTALGREVAVKILPTAFSIDRDRVHRFQQEARALCALNHPNIITIYEFGQEENIPFIVSEFIEGRTLRQCLSAEGMDPDLLLEIAIQIASALNEAHGAGIIHRDIKPENIMVRPDGLVKVLDFGLAKLTEMRNADFGLRNENSERQVTTAGDNPHSAFRNPQFSIPGKVAGTLSYMSPEQVSGKPLDARTDLFSLGVVLYEMAAGHPPFSRPTPAETIAAILEKDPAPLACAEMERIIGPALRKAPGDRYQSASELLAALRSLKQRREFQAVLEKSEERTIEMEAAPGTFFRRHAQRLALVTVLLFLLSGGIAWFAWSRLAAEKAISSIAVLPFANETGEAGMEYLSDGISEFLTDKLAQLPQLKVIAHSSSSHFREKNIDLREVARSLGVDAVVVGRVTRRNGQLLINSELVNGRERTRMWGGIYQPTEKNLPVVQTEIAREIAEELQLHLTRDIENHLVKCASINPQAYEMLLKGRAASHLGTKAGLKEALDFYQQAAQFDPSSSIVQTRLADTYRHLASCGIIDPREALPKARAAAQRSIELDDCLADAHTAIARVKIDDWDWAGAERSFKRAFELNPNSADAHSGYAHLLSILSRYEEALVQAQRAKELDPVSAADTIRNQDLLSKDLSELPPKRNKQLGFILWNARRYPEAIEVLQQNLNLNSNYCDTYHVLGYAYAGHGMYEKAVAAYREGLRHGDDSTSMRCYLGYALAMSGSRNEARALLKQLLTTREYVSPAELAILYAGLGDKEAAIHSLEKAYISHDLQLQYLNADPHFDSLRSDPRFQSIVLRTGLGPIETLKP